MNEDGHIDTEYEDRFDRDAYYHNSYDDNRRSDIDDYGDEEDFGDDLDGEDCEGSEPDCGSDDGYALASAGWGTDEDYGYFGGDD